MTDDIFGRVKSIEDQADQVLNNAHQARKKVEQETQQTLEELARQAQEDFAGHKDRLSTEAAASLNVEQEKLQAEFQVAKARLQRVRAEKVDGLADWLVTRFEEADGSET